MSKAVAVVTGASGFIAGHIVKLLLQQGYQTRGTVRDVKDEKKTAHLRKLFPALELFSANLSEEGSFDEAVKGAEVVFHTASPVVFSVTDPQKDLVDPAVNGTLNALRAVEKAGTVKRVVLTSSMASVIGDKPPGHVYTEADWNYDATLQTAPYRLSKRLAEEAAWKFAEGKSWDLVVINPSVVIGPLLSRSESPIFDMVVSLLEGTFTDESFAIKVFGLIDVRDVAKAHVLAAQTKAAKGRYIVSSEKSYTPPELAQLLDKSGEFTSHRLLKNYQGKPLENRPSYSHKKAREELGLDFIPEQETIVAAAHSLVEYGFTKSK